MNDPINNDLTNVFNELDDSNKKRSECVKAPFKWVGSKTKSLEYILPHLPYHTSYIEPFGGSGAILLARHACDLDVFNDRYNGITDFYKCLKNPSMLKRLIEYLDPIIHSRELFYTFRKNWHEMPDIVIRAAQWYYIIHFSFNAKGVTFARGTGSRCKFSDSLSRQLKNFPIIHLRLKNTVIENMDWSNCIKDYDNHDAVFYLDPPYIGVYKGTYAHEMSHIEHIKMLEVIMKMKGFVALSGYANELYDSYKWSNRIEWVSSQNAGIKTEKLELFPTKECLWIKE